MYFIHLKRVVKCNIYFLSPLFFLFNIFILSDMTPNEKKIFFLMQRVPNHWLEGLLEKCQSGSYDTVESFMTNFAAEGFSASQLLYQLHERIIFSGDLSDKQKSAIAEKMAVMSARISFA